MKIKTIHYYKEFLLHCKENIDKYNKLSHECYDIISECYSAMSEYHLILKKYDISKSLHSICFNVSKKEIKFDKYNIIECEFRHHWDTVNKLKTSLNKYSEKIKYYNLLKDIPYEGYRTILYSINLESGIELLKGNSISYPILGRFKIYNSPFNDKFPNWKESYEFKKYLISVGISPMSKSNPSGKAWLINNGVKDYFPVIRWGKGKSNLANKSYYKFKPCAYNNLIKPIDNESNLNNLINTTLYGLHNRLYAIYHKFYDYTVNNFPLKYSNDKHKKV